ncbi:MAG: EndoU domain-containing protein [Bacteroidetes bacterium]|nr:EndoU domain-containing protein [Bacteroidota bacterium]
MNIENSTVIFNGKIEKDATTFFPKNWNKQRIKEEVARAFNHKQQVIKKTTTNLDIIEIYHSKSSTGFTIEFVYKNGILKTVYPII